MPQKDPSAPNDYSYFVQVMCTPRYPTKFGTRSGPTTALQPRKISFPNPLSQDDQIYLPGTSDERVYVGAVEAVKHTAGQESEAILRIRAGYGIFPEVVERISEALRPYSKVYIDESVLQPD